MGRIQFIVYLSRIFRVLNVCVFSEILRCVGNTCVVPVESRFGESIICAISHSKFRDA